ncbi:transmembrane protease serine 11D-like [Xenopus laevis]|uniref:Transmembrane protease serine 11D-like n=1 Tax=Xenopus laevis TaxID=8355 RepID=A0A8J1M1W1_XENLA|nr:transmembrane protease serine 11D-like [Xenopus laevis]
MKSSGHCKVTIAVISFVSLTLVTAVIAAVVIVVVLGRNSSVSDPTINYYNGSFRITNINYTDDYKNSQSDAYKSMSAQIEGIISKTFDNSDVKNQYSSTKVISIR